MNDQETRTTIEDLLGPLNEVERKNAPKELFFAGDLSILDAGPRVSIVGSRKASARGLNNARAADEGTCRCRTAIYNYPARSGSYG